MASPARRSAGRPRPWPPGRSTRPGSAPPPSDGGGPRARRPAAPRSLLLPRRSAAGPNQDVRPAGRSDDLAQKGKRGQAPFVPRPTLRVGARLRAVPANGASPLFPESREVIQKGSQGVHGLPLSGIVGVFAREGDSPFSCRRCALELENRDSPPFPFHPVMRGSRRVPRGRRSCCSGACITNFWAEPRNTRSIRSATSCRWVLSAGAWGR